jgi:hypothetical protein
MVGSSFLVNIRLKQEELARDKPARLLRTFVNYGQKNIFNIGPEDRSMQHFGKKLVRLIPPNTSA